MYLFHCNQLLVGSRGVGRVGLDAVLHFCGPTVSVSRVTKLFDVSGDTGSLAALSGMTQMTRLYLYNNQLTGVSRMCVVSWTHVCRMSTFAFNCICASVWRVTILFDVCGDTGSLVPLSGMSQMTTLALFNNQLAGASASLLCFGRMMVES